MKISELRRNYHDRICTDIVRLKKDKSGLLYPNFADPSSRASREIALEVLKRIKCNKRENENGRSAISEQQAGKIFEEITRSFIRDAFGLLNHLRPGNWIYSTESITNFEQYAHLAELERLFKELAKLEHLSKESKELASALGLDYIIKPDIVIGRNPVPDAEINKNAALITPQDDVVQYSPLRQRGERPKPILHASISCKWTIRSDRSQNTRTEALNLIRNRKGHTPHIAAVTAEPLPTRIASLALGTGDLDCVYHIALPELQESIKELQEAGQLDMLQTLINGKRLRDISDLPFDLAI
ncbi:MAG: NgoMIV family type II restriction endonuclease [Roseiflexus sp.]|nr:NgoMIV family type II restriction endonuclease [Roseiflexus sp.]